VLNTALTNLGHNVFGFFELEPSMYGKVYMKAFDDYSYVDGKKVEYNGYKILGLFMTIYKIVGGKLAQKSKPVRVSVPDYFFNNVSIWNRRAMGCPSEIMLQYKNRVKNPVHDVADLADAIYQKCYDFDAVYLPLFQLNTWLKLVPIAIPNIREYRYKAIYERNTWKQDIEYRAKVAQIELKKKDNLASLARQNEAFEMQKAIQDAFVLKKTADCNTVLASIQTTNSDYETGNNTEDKIIMGN